MYRFSTVVATLVALITIAVTPLTARAQDFTPVMIKGHPAHPTRLLAKVAATPGGGAAATAASLSARDLDVVRTFSLLPGVVVLDETPRALSTSASGDGGAATAPFDAAARAAQLEQRIDALRRSGMFEYVEPDYVVSVDAVPNDPFFTNGFLWGLRNTGQNGGVAGMDIDAVRAWDITTGSPNVIVAVIDSGIRYTHVDLASRMWRNPGEIPGNGIDDDHNGYIDDVFGIDSITGSGNPSDDAGHGTHVAGTIGAAGNDGNSLVGVAWDVRLMACRFLSANGNGTTADGIECINYAVTHGAKILNLSWGGGSFSKALLDALTAARNQGVLVVASAGNNGSDNDLTPQYPASYELDNVIAVASIDRTGSRDPSSDYGRKSVHVGAPGTSIYSTFNSSDTAYLTASGTSMAAPHVSGVAALLRSQFPGISLADLRDRIVNTTVTTSGLQGATLSGGRVNAYNALTASGDGTLEISVLPLSGNVLYNGQTVPMIVRVTDLLGVRDATVSGTVTGGGTLTFRDDGVAPDVEANDTRYTAAFVLPATGTEISVAINASASGKTGATANVTFPLQQPPPNDNFANRVVLSFDSGSVTQSNLGGTLEAGEPIIARQTGGSSIWWAWTPAVDVTATISTEGSAFDTLLGVYTGTSVSALTEVASNDDIDGPDQPSKVVFGAKAGRTYQIVADGWHGKTGNIKLTIATAIAPPNDAFADRIVITGSSATVVGSTSNATSELGEPLSSTGSPLRVSIWWTWVAPSNGTARVVLTGDIPLVGVYTGDVVSALTPVRGRVSDQINRVTFSAVAGVSYHFAAGRGSLTGSSQISLALSLVNSPANDLFANRTPLAGTSATLSGSNADATNENGEPAIDYGIGGTLWWTWTAPADGTVIVVPDSGTVCGVYSGDSVTALALVASGAARFTFPVTAGTAFQIVADGAGISGTVSAALSLVDRPANDDFAKRTPIVGSSASLTTSNTAATFETGEPLINNSSSNKGASLWWTWTAPSTGTATVAGTQISPQGYTVVAVFTGETIASLSPVESCVYGPARDKRSVFHAVAGVAYQIEVDGASGFVGPLGFTVALTDSPPNDMFAARAVLSGQIAVASADATYATREAGEPNNVLVSSASSLWWEWTAPTSGAFSLSVSGASNAYVSLYSGVSLPTLTRLQTTTFQQPKLDFTAVGGTKYFIAAGDFASAPVTFKIHLFPSSAPGNNAFVNRASLVGATVSAVGSNLGATVEVSEPRHANATPNASAWWTWTAPTTGIAYVNTIGSNFDTVVAIYKGTNIAALTEVASGIATSYNSESTRLVFNAVEGTTYQIAIDGASRDVGSVALNVAMVDRPANDLFANRSSLTGQNALASGTNVAGTSESGEPASPIRTVWWTWTAPDNRVVAVSTAGSDFDTIVAVRTGIQVNGLTLIAANDDNPDGGTTTSRVVFNATAGTTYQISVDGKSGAMGSISLHLDSSPGQAPGIDSVQASAASVGAGGAVTLSATTSGAAPISYQWLLNGNPIAGANSANLTVPSVQLFQAGNYSLRISSVFGTVTSSTVALNVSAPPASTSRLANLSTRGLSLTGGDVLIPGFVVNGPANKRLLMRVVGPTLAQFGVAGTLPNPRMTLKRYVNNAYQDFAANDNWGANPNAAEIMSASASLFAFPLDATSADAALLLDVPPGQYTIIGDDAGGETGVAIVELYDADETNPSAPPLAGRSRLSNISNRGFVGTGGNIMIPGFVVSSEGAKTLLIRAVGPGLTQFGVGGVLADPQLTIYFRPLSGGANTQILAQDNWGDNSDAAHTASVATQVFAFPLTSGSKDAAFVVTLQPGIYTVQASGVGGTTGVALVEIYEVP